MNEASGFKSYAFLTAGHIVAGRHALERLSEHMGTLPPARTALVLSQPSIVKAGYVELVVRQLTGAGIACRVYADVQPEPTIGHMQTIYEQHRADGYDLVVGIGGGSVLDTAKVMSVLMTNPLTIEQMLGIDKVPSAGVPTVLVPSTSGTGSEVTPNAIVTLPEQELKIGIVSRHLLPRLAILDPLITLGLPRPVTAATGMDAFTHALESFISKKANPFSDLFALEAIRLIGGSIEAAYHDGGDVRAREDMLLGSMYGGMALTCAGTAAVHAMAYPLGGKFHIAHGVANSMLLPHVMAFNLDAIADRMPQVASAMGIEAAAPIPAADRVLERIAAWTRGLDIPQNLESFGVAVSDLPALSAAALKVERLMNNNPKRMTLEDVEAVYRKLLT